MKLMKLFFTGGLIIYQNFCIKSNLKINNIILLSSHKKYLVKIGYDDK